MTVQKLKIILVPEFCPLKSEIARFSIGFRLTLGFVQTFLFIHRFLFSSFVSLFYVSATAQSRP